MISMTTRSFLLTGSALGFLFGSTSTGFAADDAAAPAQLPAVSVEATVPPPAEGSTEAGYRVKNADLGPMGSRKVQDTPYSITTIPADLMETQQVRNISDIIKYNPSAQIEPRGDLDFGRPQTRGFENSSTQNTRIDGLNSYTIMAYPMEEYQDLEILNGAAGALYGASSPGGTFNFVSKRPTDTPMQRLTLGYDSLGSFSEHGEASGQVGAFGYRLNALHGQGEGYVSTSSQERELLSANFDVRLNDSTKLELNGSGYKDNENGFPSALVYGSGKIPASAGSGTIPSAGAALASNLPAALDPTKAGYGVVGAGQHLQDEDVSARLIHAFSPDWKLTVGGMYQNVDRTENPSGTYGAADPGNWLMSNGKIATIVGDTGLHTEVDSDIAYLNGHVETGSLTHDLILGTNGYQQTGYNRKGMNYQLGTASCPPRWFITIRPTAIRGRSANRPMAASRLW
ncbi:MAG TPA: TonB-dependent receptor plug domain-containing protein [Patescibacteria group bacterium]|nr:TonB-dependent receptor plug domain-containing protein [Patescibacteria group bacterium]